MDDDGVPLEDMEAAEGKDDADLWFLPGPIAYSTRMWPSIP